MNENPEPDIFLLRITPFLQWEPGNSGISLK